MSYPLSRETLVNLVLLGALAAAPLIAVALDEPYYVNLAARVTILAMAGVGLNLALGFGGMVSFGHAAFFGLGGYVAGIAAFHAFDGSLFIGWPFEIGGTDLMPIIWIVAMAVAAIVAVFIGAISLHVWCLFYRDHARVRADGLLLRDLLAGLWRGGRAFDLCAQPDAGIGQLRPADLLRFVLRSPSRLGPVHRPDCRGPVWGGAGNRAHEPGSPGDGGDRSFPDPTDRLRFVGDDYRMGGGAVCRPQRVCRPVDAVLADRARS